MSEKSRFRTKNLVDSEHLCDDLVVDTTDRAEEYTRSLLGVAEQVRTRSSLTDLIRRIPVMNVFSATDSGLAPRTRHMLNGKMRSMGAGLRVIAAVLLCGLATSMLPTAGVAQTRDRNADSDRGERKTAAHFEELNRKIRAAIDAGKLTPEEGRAKLREARIWHAAMATDPSEWSEELQAMILELKPDSTIEEIAEG
ncbi:MAG: hypothetical protein QGH25_22840, partial [Candidatus Latescibacteria bacterium]|nr:hypothetical protein [Candidatus Latescibacterota bacterium]